MTEIYEYKDLIISNTDTCLTIKNKEQTHKFNHINYNFITTDNIIENHFARLLNVRECNNFKKIYTFIKDNINYIFSYCTICGKKIPDLEVVSSCSTCFDKSLEIVTDDLVTNFFKKDKLVFNVIVLAGYSCLLNSHADQIMKPLPKIFNPVGILRSKLNYGVENFGKLIETVKLCSNDYKLQKKIELDYSFIKYLIKTNTTNLMSNILFDKEDNVCANEDIDNILDCEKIITFNVCHTSDKEEEFSGIKAYYLFHGSPIGCWHSILKDGLKNLSNTSLMTSGAAYGAGIYLGGNFDTSQGYGIDRFGKLPTITVGVIQVKHDIKKFNKGGDIYVVPDESELLLKHLIVIASGKRKDIKKITNYFTKEKVKEIDNATSDLKLIRIKRLNVECEKIDKLRKKIEFEYTFDDNVFIVSSPNLRFNIKLMTDYPMVPPFIWISKISKNLSHDVTVLENGCIVIKEILISNWSTKTKLCQLIEKIISSITEVNIKIKTYTYNKAFMEFCENKTMFR
jgi:ubiquitin-protein ligase